MAWHSPQDLFPAKRPWERGWVARDICVGKRPWERKFVSCKFWFHRGLNFQKFGYGTARTFAAEPHEESHVFLQVFYVLVSDLLVDMHLILGLMTVSTYICSQADTSFYLMTPTLSDRLMFDSSRLEVLCLNTGSGTWLVLDLASGFPHTVAWASMNNIMHAINHRQPKSRGCEL